MDGEKTARAPESPPGRQEIWGIKGSASQQNTLAALTPWRFFFMIVPL
jgi:hypothetical protein